MPCTLAVFPRESPDPGASSHDWPIYRPRKAETSPLWQLVAHHAHAFLDVYDERHASQYGPLRKVAPRALENFQCPRCGGTMKSLAVIERPAIVRQIRSAELATKPRPPGPPQRSGELPRAPRPDQRPAGRPPP